MKSNALGQRHGPGTKKALPEISWQAIEGTILGPSTPPRMSHGIHL